MTMTDRLAGINEGVAAKAACRVATTANISLSGLQTIDGVALSADDRVLVKDQTTTADNGIYIASAGTWERAPDFDGSRDVVNGTLVVVTAGTANANILYRLSATDPVTIGTSALTFLASTTFSTISGYAATLLDDANAAAARTTLGLGNLATLDTVGSAQIDADAVTFAKFQNITTSRLLGRTTAASGDVEEISVGSGLTLSAGSLSVTAGSGKPIVQVVESASGSVATGTTIIPSDDTVPQNTEGTQFLSLAITPTSATNYLEIEITTIMSGSTATNFITAALFQDTTASALAAAWGFGQTNETVCLTFKHRMLAGTTSATTFKVRGGISAAGTCTFNGYAGGRILGGAAASRILIKEITA